MIMTILQAILSIIDIGYACVFFSALCRLLPIRKQRLIQVIALVLFVWLWTTPMYSHTLLNILRVISGLTLHIVVFFRGRWTKKLLTILMFLPVMAGVNYLTYDFRDRVFYGVTGISDTAADLKEEELVFGFCVYIAIALIRLIFAVLVYHFTVKYMARISEKMTVKMSLLLCMLLLAPNIAVYTMIYFMPEHVMLVYPICVTSILSGFGFIYFAAYICENMELAYHAQELEMQQAMYTERQREEEKVRRIYHDMKNHLLILQSQIDGIEKESREIEASKRREITEQMITSLEDQLSDYENDERTGNVYLDVMIRSKAKAAKERGIDFYSEIDFSGGDFMEGLDISTIFGNALDNAIEACEKLAEEERFITVKAGRKHAFLAIQIENAAIKENRKERTTKRDRFLHGFGSDNIQRTVQKYGGECRTEYANGVFSLSILIPTAA